MVRFGMEMEPFVRERPPLATVSFVVPPWLVSWVVLESRVRVIEEPGAAAPGRGKTMGAICSPGALLSNVNGTWADPSANVAIQEIEPLVDGDDSNVGDSPAVI